MNVIIVVGRPRQGKSWYVKSMISHPRLANRGVMAYDPQNEYGATYQTDINGVVTTVPGVGLPEYRPGLMRARYTGSIENFIAIVCEKENDKHTFTNRNIYFEEATIFFKGGMSKEVRDLIISRFHTRNNLIFVFHKLGTIPPDIMDFSNRIILFKTYDTQKTVDRRFDSEILSAAFKIQNAAPDKAKPIIVDRQNNKINGRPF